ncbi:MAG: DUF4384 domain-containing protein [Treponema sp.]|nr:DUF4384 domain-containing protein [Treponema sp.]
MKRFLTLSIAFLFILVCPVFSQSSLTIDTAIAEAGSYFTQRINQGAKVAIVHIDAPTGRLSDYIFEELWGRFEDSRKFIMIDRRNLDRIETEINHQYRSGKVDDNTLISMTRQYGAEFLIHGQMTALGNEFRITFYSTDVERASSSQRAYNVRNDSRLSALLNVPADEEVERAVAGMARAVSQRTTIAIGRISYADTQTVSSLSAWLKNSIIAGAQKQRDKLQIATESESADFAVASRGLTVETPVTGSGNVNSIQAVVTGSYSPLDSGAEVLMQLVSTSGSKVVLATSRFVISGSELERRRLSLLPDKGNAALTLSEFETKQQAIDPYAGRNNRWTFTVTPDVLDGIYRDNDYMTMRIYSERDCYFRITHVDINGVTQVIYPVSPEDNNFIRAGQTRRIPDNTRYRMGPPFGEEMILAAAYDRPFLPGQPSGTLSHDSISRGLSVQDNRNTQMSPSVTANFSYTILPR